MRRASPNMFWNCSKLILSNHYVYFTFNVWTFFYLTSNQMRFHQKIELQYAGHDSQVVWKEMGDSVNIFLRTLFPEWDVNYIKSLNKLR